MYSGYSGPSSTVNISTRTRHAIRSTHIRRLWQSCNAPTPTQVRGSSWERDEVHCVSSRCSMLAMRWTSCTCWNLVISHIALTAPPQECLHTLVTRQKELVGSCEEVPFSIFNTYCIDSSRMIMPWKSSSRQACAYRIYRNGMSRDM